MLKKYIRIGLSLSVLLHIIVCYSMYATLFKTKIELNLNEPYFEMVSVDEEESEEENIQEDDVKKIIEEMKQQPNILDAIEKFEKDLKKEPEPKIKKDKEKPKPEPKVEKKPDPKKKDKENPKPEPKKDPKKTKTDPQKPQTKQTNAKAKSSNNANHNAMPSQSELANFVSKIRSEIDDLWHAENFNNPKALESTVEFSIDPYGKLVYVKIIKSSGNNHFDKLLISLFQKLPAIKPPSSQTLAFSLTFKSNKD